MTMKIVALLFLSILAGYSMTSAQDESPYIYYYSDEHQAFVIERADGTDTRLIVSVPSGEYSSFGGPGWSPDGQWFAWVRHSGKVEGPQAAVVNVLTGERVETLEFYYRVTSMIWSPNSHFLLVGGQHCDCLFFTYWLIDVQADLLKATLDIAPGGASGSPSIEWLPDNGGVVFYEIDGVAVGNVLPRTRITLYADGRVTKEPVTRDEWNAIAIRPPSGPSEVELVSPSGRYALIGRNRIAEITDLESGTTVPVPPFQRDMFRGDMGWNDFLRAYWHPSEEWVFLLFQLGEASYATTILKTDGTVHRELSACRNFTVCAGWLPDNVDVESIPLLEDAP